MVQTILTSVRSFCHSGNSRSELSGIHSKKQWIPAFAGMTYQKSSRNNHNFSFREKLRIQVILEQAAGKQSIFLLLSAQNR